MFNWFKRKDPVVIEAAKEAAMVDMVGDMLNGGMDVYIRHSVLAWQEIETLAAEETQNEATMVFSAFKLGFLLMGGTYAKAGGTVVDLESHNEGEAFSKFGLKVARRAFPDEKELKAFFSAAQYPGRTKDAYHSGMTEAERFIRSMDGDTMVTDPDALKNVLKSVFDRKAHFVALRAEVKEREASS